MTYLITFACYGAHLHGNETGSIDRHHNRYGSPALPMDLQRISTERQAMTQSPYVLDHGSRAMVLNALRETCLHHRWALLAAHVRTNHVHVVVEADVPPEKVMNALKSYASRSLNRLESEHPGRKRWARHGSTRWLWKDEEV